MITFAGVTDVYTSSTGHTKTKGNFIRATFDALANTYKFLSPDLWAINPLPKSPYEEYSEYLQRAGKKNKNY
jgi:small subunit ribosomal protein S2e